MNEMMGIILAGGRTRRLDILTKNRAVAALPVGGSFRCIDYSLSSMTHSGIKCVGVLTQFNARSLTRHLNSATWWNFGRKHGGLFVLTPSLTENNREWYRGTADAIYQNIDFIKRRHEEYVVVCNGDCVYRQDFREVLEAHIASGADITVICKELESGRDYSRFAVVTADEEGNLLEIEEDPMFEKALERPLVSTGAYILPRKLLIELLEQNAGEMRYDFVKDVIQRNRRVKKIRTYMMPEGQYWSNIADLQEYYRTNMDFLKKEVREYFFRGDQSILTKVRDMPPAKFNAGSKVTNSVITSGTVIEGTVRNSVIFKRVQVAKNCEIENCILLNNVYIKSGVKLKNCIVESYSRITESADGSGEPGGIKVVKGIDRRYLEEDDAMMKDIDD